MILEKSVITIIKGGLAPEGIKSVLMFSEISDGAKILYGYYSTLRMGDMVNDEYVIKQLGLSKAVLASRKKELRDVSLLVQEKVRPNIYMYYLGDAYCLATDVFNEWLDRQDKVIE